MSGDKDFCEWTVVDIDVLAARYADPDHWSTVFKEKNQEVPLG